MCRLLGVSASGYYASRRRPLCQRHQEDARLRELIVAIHARSRGTYGVPRIRAELRFDHGVHCSRKRVWRLMRQLHIHGAHRRRRVRTTMRSPEAAPAPDLLNRNFTATRPDEVWLADITYIWTREGFLYLAAVVDVFTRQVVGWAMANHLQTQLVLDALDMALWRRNPSAPLIHHSDQGTQYTSLAYGRRLRQAAIAPSMGSRGDAYDNALAESFFATFETELLDRELFLTRSAARMAAFDFIEAWYNPWRRHSSLGQISPAEFERQWRATRQTEEVMA
jgi:putative transposase